MRDSTNKQLQHLWKAKLKILEANGLSINGKFAVFKTECPLSWNFITVLRIIFCSAIELYENAYQKVFEDELVSTENEILVRKFLIELCQAALSQYPTTLQEDELLLRSDTLGHIERSAIILRREEKILLARVLSYATAPIK